jgi:hypothetical protein
MSIPASGWLLRLSGGEPQEEALPRAAGGVPV